MTKVRSKPTSSFDKLIDSLMRLCDEAKQRMTSQEFDEAEQQVHDIAERVRARKKKPVMTPTRPNKSAI